MKSTFIIFILLKAKPRNKIESLVHEHNIISHKIIINRIFNRDYNKYLYIIILYKSHMVKINYCLVFTLFINNFTVYNILVIYIISNVSLTYRTKYLLE